MRTITGFHAIEERILRGGAGISVIYCKVGPRVRRIIELCKERRVVCSEANVATLDCAVSSMPDELRDHRGIVLLDSSDSGAHSNMADFDTWLAEHEDLERVIVVILDGITDEHNVGAILRSCDQFGVSLVVLPERRGVSNIAGNAVVLRASAGASSWVNIAVVKNVARTVRALKNAGFWVYRADARGDKVGDIQFAPRTALVMGSEGGGVSRLIGELCDMTVAIPTCGKIDSLNVSVAAGILLYVIGTEEGRLT